jgi:hypothetical protein
MPRRKPVARVTALLLALLALVLVAGCGGGGDEASSSTPVDQLLRETFSGNKQVTSGKLSIALNVDAKGGATQGPISARISGPFESQGKGKLPEFALTADLSGGGQNLSAGLTSTGDKGFVRFQGTDYAVTDQIFQQFRKGYEQAQAQGGSNQGRSLASLGIDPQKWLTNAHNAGEAKVGDTDTIRITGGVDVPKLLDDVDMLLQKTRQLGGSAAQNIPQQLTEKEKQQAAKAVKSLSVEIYTGKDDKILRRMVINLSVQAPQGATTAGTAADVRLDVQLTDVNEGQDISAPSNPKPFDQLLSKLGGLGLGTGGAGAGSTGSGSSGTGSTGGASADNLQKYSECIQKAGNDATKARKCANLLTP